MSKYIDAEKIPWTDLNDGRGGVNVYVTFLEKAARIPAADVVEVRHGHWETIDKGHFFYDWKCSKCGGSGRADYRFCPNCGASMRGEEE